jgi:DNA repair protein RadC
MKQINAIKFWAEDDRPREKMKTKGRSALSDAELLAIIIGSGNRELSAVALSRQILASVDYNFSKLSRLSIANLNKFNGIGDAKAISILATLEIARRKGVKSVLLPLILGLQNTCLSYLSLNSWI